MKKSAYMTKRDLKYLESPDFIVYLSKKLSNDKKSAFSVGHYNDYELNINAYGNRFGIDLAYQSSTSLSGDVTVNDVDYFLERGTMDMKMFSLNAYYAFNGRRFSYPAAFSQSYIQKHSAGSWLVGLSYLGGSLKTQEDKPDFMPSYRIYVGHLGIGGGYGYNFVLGRRWMIHLSALPTLVITNRNNITEDGERRKMATKFPELLTSAMSSGVPASPLA